MTHPSRNAKRKMFRRKMWARIYPDNNCVLWDRRPPPTFYPGTCRIARVLITEIPPKPERSKK